MRGAVGLVLLVVAGLAVVGLAVPREPTGPAQNEIRLTPENTSVYGGLIRGRGYNCPEPKLLFAQGADAYGDVVKVYCGPSDREGVYENAVFRVTFRPNNIIALVAPWK